MARFPTLDDLDVAGKTVLVRVDFNVPMHDGNVTDATRIERATPTLIELADKSAKVVLLSHFGRPKGKAEPSMSLAPVAKALRRVLNGRRVLFAEDCVGAAAKTVVDQLAPGELALLENLRFHAAEEKPQTDPSFADRLADLGDLYVNDAFSCSHRAHASITELPARLPSAAGRLLQAELEALERALEAPQRPAAALIGGAKISSKLDVLGHLLNRVDLLIIGGGMANTFLHAKGVDIGKSLCEKDLADTARQIMRDAKTKGCEIVLPTDALVATEFKERAEYQTLDVDSVPANGMILDIGPQSAAAIGQALKRCHTLLWNGPLGAFEIKPFDQGTNAVAEVAAAQTKAGQLLSVAGGGDTVAALANAGVLEQFSYVSTAGGAFLEWLEGKDLPGIAALLSAKAPA